MVFVGQGMLHGAFNLLAERQERFVLWGADLPGQHYCSIGSDNALGAQRATLHLARLGRRRIAFLGQSESPEILQRYRSYRDALGEAGLHYDDALVIPAHFNVESAQAATEGLLNAGKPIDGIVAADDTLAFGAMRALQRAGLSIPDDVALIGYGNSNLGRHSNPSLTTIDQDMTMAGRLMLAKLLDITGTQVRRSERLPADLIIRESCGG